MTAPDWDRDVLEATFSAFGVIAIYTPLAGPTISFTALQSGADQINRFQDTRVLSDRYVFRARVSELPSPITGTSITIGADIFVIKGDPVFIDPSRLVWEIDTYRQA